MSQGNVDKVRSSLDGWNRGDVDAWLEFAHPEIEWFSEVAMRMQGTQTVFRGPAGMRNYWDEWHDLAYVFEFDAGLARKVRAYLDPREALEAVGMVE